MSNRISEKAMKLLKNFELYAIHKGMDVANEEEGYDCNHSDVDFRNAKIALISFIISLENKMK